MLSHLYRYRSVQRVLESNELEQFYFAPPEDLNDPIEGFKDIVWQGDEVVWRNFIRHYLLCLLDIAPACFIGGSEFDKRWLRNRMWIVPDDLPDAPLKAIYGRASGALLRNPITAKFVQLMAARTAPLRRTELTSYLQKLHPIALKIVFNELSSFGLMAPPIFLSDTSETYSENVIRMMEGAAQLHNIENATEWSAEAFFAMNESTVMQLDLYSELQVEDREKNRPWAFYCKYFPSIYVSALDILVHPNCYIASFSATATNASMWGSYGKNHTGIALKFRATPNSVGEPSIPLNAIVGSSGPNEKEVLHRSFVPHTFHKVEYHPAFPEINFFRSMGHIPQGLLHRFWYRGDDGTYSQTGREAFKDAEAKAKYWQDLDRSFLYKTKDWEHEEEYRLLLHSGFDLTKPNARTLQFRFEDLTGLVFGARTDLEDKVAVLKKVEAMCRTTKRTDFEIWEVRYAPETSTFRLSKLDLLKMEFS